MNQAEPDDSGHTTDAARRAATFEQIISTWVKEGTVPRWPTPPAPTAAADSPHRTADPPPIPRLGMGTCIGLALLGLGALILALPSMLGHDCTLALPLSVISFAGGTALVIHRRLCRYSG